VLLKSRFLLLRVSAKSLSAGASDGNDADLSERCGHENIEHHDALAWNISQLDVAKAGVTEATEQASMMGSV
jgi:autotransporter adhesin